ncbi:hypothetical protein [Lentzea sp. E54]|uniref:hypothetical protein n=1 Tax=Lentzea xerophila TaxID=3435883 RepID=UPI003DA55A2E
MLSSKDLLGDTARATLERALPGTVALAALDRVVVLLIGPIFFRVASGRDPSRLDPRELVDAVLCSVGQ